MNITEFLLARVAEEAADAQEVIDAELPHEWAGDDVLDAWPGRIKGTKRGWTVMCIDARRVLAECEAKRRIINDRAFRESQRPDVLSIFGERIMAALAQPYADHADFNPKWIA